MEQFSEQLIEKGLKLNEVDNEILNCLLESKVSEKEYTKEYDACEEYNEKLVICKVKVKQRLSGATRENPRINLEADMPTSNFRSLRLPEMNLKQFDGDARAWINFWNMFKKIHEDSALDDHSKFVYLIQAIKPKSKAYDIVNSYPMSPDNYLKVISHLKERFGREDTLIQIYVRDLLQLVLSNNSSSKKEVNLSKLYDHLETKLRSLESLGVTEDKYASILFPLVESCLPYDTLRIWEREREKSESGKSDLFNILNFLKNEVISEERVILARTTLSLDKDVKTSRLNYISNENNVPTANDLFNGDKYKDKHFSKKFNDIVCVFCDKNHLSERCFKASSLSFEDKKNLILRKGVCFICFKSNHISRNCRSKITCTICKKRHFAVMCQNTLPNEVNSAVESRQLEAGNTDSVLTTHASDSTVLLQTLCIRVKHEGKQMIVRAVVDTGSERSYLSEDVIKNLNYKSCGDINLIHKLFGGIETKETKHQKYKIHLSSIDNSYNCNMYVLNAPVICSEIRKVPHGPWLNELNKSNIRISDVENNKLNVDNSIKLLIGSDVAGKLLTGNVRVLRSGPVAVKTYLGWVLMGKIPRNETETNNSLLVISSLWNESPVSDLWKLDIIGITDPIESKTKLEIQNETMNYFKNTIRIDSDGRYEVALPWVIDNSHLPNNRELAEKRLITTKRKLSSLNKTQVYTEVFNMWLSEGIIEKVSDDKMTQAHYLPHRPVFKESSATTKVRPVFDASAHIVGFPSLNECLDKGLNLIEVIPSLLNRFRKFSVGVISDIEKAFLQISITEKDRNYLRFLWEQWRHVAGKYNPADIPSRGCSAEKFLQLKWWEGPSWLKEPESSWPERVESPNENIINSEKRKSVTSVFNKNAESNDWYYRRFSSYRKTVRLISWILRFVNNCRKINSKEDPELTFSELQEAEKRLLILIQRDKFSNENDKKIRDLRPIVDEDGIIRVKTQVMYREDTHNFRYPILLPSYHPVVHRQIFWKHLC